MKHSVPEWVNSRYNPYVYITETDCTEKRKIKHLGVSKILLVAFGAAVLIGGCYANSTPTTEIKPTTYTVQQGETLWDISKKIVGEEKDCRPVYQKIADDNGIKNGHIVPGQKLIIK